MRIFFDRKFQGSGKKLITASDNESVRVRWPAWLLIRSWGKILFFLISDANFYTKCSGRRKMMGQN